MACKYAETLTSSHRFSIKVVVFVFWFLFLLIFFIDCRRRLAACTTHVSKTYKTSWRKKKQRKAKKYKIKSASTSLGPISSFLSFASLLVFLFLFLRAPLAIRFSLFVPFNVFVNIIATTPITDCLRDFNRFVVKCEI